MIVLIDDVRTAADADIIIRNGITAMEFLYLYSQVTIDKLYLDHDLGDAVSGYDIAKAIEVGNFDIKEICIVSANSVGIKNIQAALQKKYNIGPSGRILKQKEN